MDKEDGIFTYTMDIIQAPKNEILTLAANGESYKSLCWVKEARHGETNKACSLSSVDIKTATTKLPKLRPKDQEGPGGRLGDGYQITVRWRQ